MLPQRPKRFALGCSTPKRRTSLSQNVRGKFYCPLAASMAQNTSEENIEPNLCSLEDSFPILDSEIETNDSNDVQNKLDSSFVTAVSVLEDDIQNVNWTSPITTNTSRFTKRKSMEDIDCVISKKTSLTQMELENLSDDMFESRMELSCIKNHDTSPVCKTTQFRKQMDTLFDKLGMSIIGLDESTIEKTVKPDESQMTELFSTKDSFMLNVNENEIMREPSRIIQPVSTTEKHDFYGLPPVAKQLMKTYKNVEKLYDWQDECLNLEAIKQRRNLIYALPTSGGKTLVAEILMLKEVYICKKNVLFILPFVALVQEKVWGLSPFAVQMNFLIEEYAAGKGNLPPKKRRKKNSIYIATLEKGLSLVRSLIELNRLDEIGLIVVDELHLIGEPTRGSSLEMMLASIMFIPNDIQIVGMSATIGNIDELATFMKAEVYSNQFRPVELKEYVKVGTTINSITMIKSGLDVNVERQVNYGYSAQVEKLDPDHLGGLVMEVIPKGSCLIFCNTKKNCENVAVLLCKVIFRQLLEHKTEEKKALIKSLHGETGKICSVLAGTVPWGVAYHHSGLTSEERRLLEDNFRSGVLSVLCCTSTLAAGVNLPASRVILRTPFVGREFISLSKYKQMVGRAGRAGFGDAGESITICPPELFGQLCELVNQPMDRATSVLHEQDFVALRGFVLSAVGLGMATTREQIQQLVAVTLMAVQAERLDLCLKQLTNETLKSLISSGALEVVQPVQLRWSKSAGELNDDGKQKIVVYSNSTFRVSKLGKAAIRGCMEFRMAQQVFTDMQQAQRGLVVAGVLHLLYLVTPYEYAEIRPNMTAYYSAYSALDKELLLTANALGITESVAVRMVTGKCITTVPEKVLARFYVALMLYDLWCEIPVAEVAEKYHVNRGTVQSMMVATASFASNVLRFCEELEDFWAFRYLLEYFCKRLAHCCAPELLSLMELPSVKKARAKQLYKAGYKRLEDIAKASPSDLAESVDHLSLKLAAQLISSAKMLLIERVENLRDEAEEVMDGLGVLSLQ